MIMHDQLAPRTRRNAPWLRLTMLDDFNRRDYFRTTPLLCCCRGLARGLLLCTLPALTAHLVGIPAVVTHHLEALVWNVLRDSDEGLAHFVPRTVAAFIVAFVFRFWCSPTLPHDTLNQHHPERLNIYESTRLVWLLCWINYKEYYLGQSFLHIQLHTKRRSVCTCQ